MRGRSGLIALVVVSLVLDVFLIFQWFIFRQQVLALGNMTRASLTQSITDLDGLRKGRIEIDVPVDQQIPVNVVLPFRETLEIPISTTLPIHQVIDTTITVNLLGTTVPVPVSVPLDLQVPVNLRVPIAISTTVPISTSIPIRLSAPVRVDLEQTVLAGYIDRLRTSLANLRNALPGEGGNPPP